MEIAIEMAVAKTHKYASRDSGDTVEIVERPNGGLSLLLIDGQGSGRGARDISQMLVSRGVTMIKDGVRDGAVARALNDILLAYRHGQVSATLDLVSVDLQAEEVIITRQGGTVGVVRIPGGAEALPDASPPLGRYRMSRPQIWQYPIEDGVLVVLTTDGVSGSGQRQGRETFDLCGYVDGLDADLTAQQVADAVLAESLGRDANKPGDDSAVGVLRLSAMRGDGLAIRRMAVELPVR